MLLTVDGSINASRFAMSSFESPGFMALGSEKGLVISTIRPGRIRSLEWLGIVIVRYDVGGATISFGSVVGESDLEFLAGTVWVAGLGFDTSRFAG